MKSFRDIKAWEKAHALTLRVYRVTAAFPRDEIYGITSQLRRAASSIPTNIAEGCGRNTDSELRRFLEIAMGSASETEYLLLLARDLAYVDNAIHTELTSDVVETKKMLAAFINKLKADR
jgi:four helix bundle protein